MTRRISARVAALGFLLVALELRAGVVLAAPKAPRVSPAASVTLDVGVTNVRIDYHRPGVKGRVIWGGLVPWDKVWRMGANNATKITVADPFRVGGVDLAAGSYALFAIPRADRFTIVLNQDAGQWGAFFHDPAKDVARFDVTPQTGPAVEWLSFSISPVDEGKATVEMAWETVRVSFPLEVDTRKVIWASIDKALAENPKDADTLLIGARYAVESGERQAEAIVWVETAMTVKEHFRFYETKADLLAAAGRKTEAVALLDKVLELAPKAGAPEEYLSSVQKKKAAWKGGSN